MHCSDLDKIDPLRIRDYIDMLGETAEAMSLLLRRIEELEEEVGDYESEISEKREEIDSLESRIAELEAEIEELREAREREVDISDFTPATLDKISAAVERREKTLEFDGPWISDERMWQREGGSAEVVIFLPNDQYLCHRRLRRAPERD